jgi:hypothetical protein
MEVLVSSLTNSTRPVLRSRASRNTPDWADQIAGSPCCCHSDRARGTGATGRPPRPVGPAHRPGERRPSASAGAPETTTPAASSRRCMPTQ